MGHEPEVIYDFDPRNLPPELLRAIGLMAAASAPPIEPAQSAGLSIVGRRRGRSGAATSDARKGRTKAGVLGI